MNQKSQRFFRLSAVLGVAILLLGVLFGAVSAAPHPNAHQAPAASASAHALLQPAAQGVTGSIQTQPGQPGGAGGNGGAPTTTTNVNVGIPGWVWIVVVLILVVIVALIASGNRGGGGGGTTVIKD